MLRRTSTNIMSDVYLSNVKSVFGTDVYVEAGLVDLYAGCGVVKDARKVLDRMCGRDVVCWTAMISAYEQGGRGGTALELVEEMQDEDLRMDWMTCVTIASAVGQLSDVKSGKIEVFMSYNQSTVECYKVFRGHMEEEIL
nr:pentatricopeptide repeat-containing protein At2g01510, mitochondrial [Tanacetum cinerariifolium]